MLGGQGPEAYDVPRESRESKYDNDGIMTRNEEPIDYPIDGTLDLHQFTAGETKEVVEEYIRVCLEKKIYAIRIVHGKGKGVKRRIVESLLKKHTKVERFYQESDSFFISIAIGEAA